MKLSDIDPSGKFAQELQSLYLYDLFSDEFDENIIIVGFKLNHDRVSRLVTDSEMQYILLQLIDYYWICLEIVLDQEPDITGLRAKYSPRCAYSPIRGYNIFAKWTYAEDSEFLDREIAIMREVIDELIAQRMTVDYIPSQTLSDSFIRAYTMLLDIMTRIRVQINTQLKKLLT